VITIHIVGRIVEKNFGKGMSIGELQRGVSVKRTERTVPDFIAACATVSALVMRLRRGSQQGRVQRA
jgi:hypothetical protein